MDYEVVIVAQGDDRYEEVLGAVRGDRALLDLMWHQAEFELIEHPAKVWIAAVDPVGRPLAWCAIEPTDQMGAQVKAVDSCERPECWAEDVYGVIYAARHELLRNCAAVTYIFDEPLTMHLWDGWVPFAEGWSSEPGEPPHHWTGLFREADPRTA